MTTRSATIIGVFVLLAAGLHAGLQSVLATSRPTRSAPLHTGYVQGKIIYRISPTSTGEHRADGSKVEMFENFVLVYIDKQKNPTWGNNYVLAIPWHDIEDMTLQPEP